MNNMSNIYNLSVLPDQYKINLIADFYDDFTEDCVDIEMLLANLKANMISSGLLSAENHQRWFFTRGMDYFYNPKLFAYAPLNCVCIFLSELFKLFNIDEISKNVPEMVIKCALSRLTDFKHAQALS